VHRLSNEQLHITVATAFGGAAANFLVSAKTLARRLRASGTEPGRDGKYWTAQIAAAIYDEGFRQRLKKVEEETALLQLKREPLESELIPTRMVPALVSAIASAIREKILASPLPEEERREILAELTSLQGSNWEDKAAADL